VSHATDARRSRDLFNLFIEAKVFEKKVE